MAIKLGYSKRQCGDFWPPFKLYSGWVVIMPLIIKLTDNLCRCPEIVNSGDDLKLKSQSQNLGRWC